MRSFEAITYPPDLGEEIYTAWVETMDVANPDDVNLNVKTLKLLY